MLLSISLYAEGHNTSKLQSDSTVMRYKDGTRIYGDSAIYQGMCVKLDIGNTILELVASRAKIQSYEVSTNWRLKNRFYPTFEAGYSLAEASAEGGDYKGQGGFMRVGMDINGFKKHITDFNALLVGLRIGTGMQNYSTLNTKIHDDYWGKTPTTDFKNMFSCDAWGEVVAGCQVQIWEGFMMGWYVRLKVLFTRSSKNYGVLPYYIPGFGYRDNTNWGFNYYIGWKF